MGYYNNVHYILSTATACYYIINYLDLNPSMPKPHGIFRLQPPDVTLIKAFQSRAGKWTFHNSELILPNKDTFNGAGTF